MQDLLGAWRMVRTHPFGILLPAAADLALGVLFYVHVGDTIRVGGLAMGLMTWVMAQNAYAILRVPLRGLRIAAGARAVGHPIAGVRPGPLLVVSAIATFTREVVLLAVVLPAVSVATTLADSGWIGSGLLVAGFGVIAGQIGALAAEALFAGAPIEVVVGGRSSIHAVSRSLQQARSAAIPRFLLLAAGRAATLAGGLICGAGALPGYALDDLAVLHHWVRHFSPHRGDATV